MRCSLLDNGVFFYPERNNLSADKPCCMFAPGNQKAYPLRKIEFKDILNSFNDPHRLKAIESLEKGEQFVSCSTCWKHEGSGYKSMRTRTSDLWKKSEPGVLKFLELNTGNTCNIQCIMCNPSDSLKTQVYTKLKEKFDKDFKSEINKWHESRYARGLRKSDIDGIDFTVFKDLEYLKSTGGETFYSKEYWYMLEKLAEKGYAENIMIINVTNNTIALDDHKLDILKQFKKIKIFSSVDGIGDLCESVRAGSKWSQVEDNIKHLIELSDQYPEKFIHTEPHSVVQVANALQLDEIVNWWHLTARENFKDKLYFRILDDPRYYDIKILSKDIKNSIINKYHDKKELKHVSNYAKVNLDNFNEEYSNIGMTIYEESCKINDADPDSSKVYRMIKDGV